MLVKLLVKIINIYVGTTWRVDLRAEVNSTDRIKSQVIFMITFLKLFVCTVATNLTIVQKFLSFSDTRHSDSWSFLLTRTLPRTNYHHVSSFNVYSPCIDGQTVFSISGSLTGPENDKPKEWNWTFKSENKE